MRKKHILLFVLLILAVFLTACGKKTKSDSEIQEDVLSRASFIEDYHLANTQFAISKRETDKNTDTVWTSVEASSELMQYHADCTLVYALYNDGWELDSVTWNNQSFTGNLDAITEDEANKTFWGAYANEFDWSEFLGREDSLNKVLFRYNAGSEEYYLKREYTVTLEFTFDPDDSWNPSSVTKTLTSETYDLVGEWRYESDSRQYYVNVLDFNTKTKTITYEYNFHDDGNIGSLTWALEDAKTDGPVTGKCYQSWSPSSDIIVLELEPPTNHLRNIEIVIGGQLTLDAPKPSGAGIAMRGYFLKKQ